ncbi:DNA methyltransferase [Desulfobacterales bacterium HSG16]|nr:DNA methyltransferase [Desulfobacterales bacterium HSG16]
MRTNPADILTKGMYHRLFPDHLRITPNLKEVYELALAFYESRILDEDEIIRNGAYFSRVGDKYTHHFLMCTGDPVRLPHYSSSRLKSFFEDNQFRTGYSTHGLFPYRGKFHPQMVKAIINIMGLKSGDTILDPMMGSGTVLIEAALMGIKSFGLDASPFCRFMTQTKLDAFTLPLDSLYKALKNYRILFQYFSNLKNCALPGNDKSKAGSSLNYDDAVKRSSPDLQSGNYGQYIEAVESNDIRVHNFLLLAYFDSKGYSQRSKRKNSLELFHKILERYIFVIEKIQQVLHSLKLKQTRATAIQGDTRFLPFAAQSMDGILFSPPYSFAIDYLKNDSSHLDFMNADVSRLQEIMVGLRGRTIKDKYNFYVEDMNKVLSECARVLRPACFCTIIIGTNDNQLSKALRIPKEQVKGLHMVLTDIAVKHGFTPVRLLPRQISGISNTMRSEYIVILQKV